MGGFPKEVAVRFTREARSREMPCRFDPPIFRGGVGGRAPSVRGRVREDGAVRSPLGPWGSGNAWAGACGAVPFLKCPLVVGLTPWGRD